MTPTTSVGPEPTGQTHGRMVALDTHRVGTNRDYPGFTGLAYGDMRYVDSGSELCMHAVSWTEASDRMNKIHLLRPLPMDE